VVNGLIVFGQETFDGQPQSAALRLVDP